MCINLLLNVKTVWCCPLQSSLVVVSPLRRWGRCSLTSLFQLHGNQSYSGNGTRSEPLYKTKTGYYEILEVSPTSTQAQIKTAYYKQSFIYHPDRNAGSDQATIRFSEISEAYTVLGNKGLRKKYDRGLLTASDLTGTARPSAKASGKPQAESRRSVVGRESQGGMFDFDEFFRSHYSEQLQRQRDIRVRKEEMLRKQQETAGDKKLGKMTEVGVGLLMVTAIYIILSLRQ
uniref:J domain-containing protein n=1 Tax=Amphiprion ocellaris TaxID=80972 RepID=A0A3Q1C873_AMPOC